MLPAVQLVLNGRESIITGVSPFFLAHGYQLEPFKLFDELAEPSNTMTPAQKGDAIVTKLKDAVE